MDNLKLNIKALAAKDNLTIKELAEKSGIEYTHLRLVSCGQAKMLGTDLLALSRATGVPPELIDPE